MSIGIRVAKENHIDLFRTTVNPRYLNSPNFRGTNNFLSVQDKKKRFCSAANDLDAGGEKVECFDE